MNEKNQQEILRLGMIEQQINSLSQQLQAVEKEIVDLELLEIGLDELKESEGKEILAAVGKGIFTKAKLISNDLTVDIGNGNLVKKSVIETQRLIKNQIEKLEKTKDEINANIELIAKDAEKILGKIK